VRHPRVTGLLAGATTLLLLISACQNQAAEAGPDGSSPAHGTEFAPATHPHIAVKHGDKFSIVVSENSSAGDAWQLKVPPDPKIAKTEPEDVAGGKRYFVFTATAPGESALEIVNSHLAAGYDVHLQVL
jgi:predicted secreted protein